MLVSVVVLVAVAAAAAVAARRAGTDLVIVELVVFVAPVGQRRSDDSILGVAIPTEQLVDVVLLVDAGRPGLGKFGNRRLDTPVVLLHQVGTDEEASPIEAVRAVDRNLTIGVFTQKLSTYFDEQLNLLVVWTLIVTGMAQTSLGKQGVQSCE